MAVSELLWKPGTSVVFKSSGGDITFTPQNIASADARVSAQWDRGSGSKPGWYRWFGKTKSSASYTIGRAVQIYLGQAKDATDIPSNLGTSDASISSAVDRMRPLDLVGAIVAPVATGSTALVQSGLLFIHSRYVSVVWFNDLGVTLTNTAGDHEFQIEPLSPESQ